MLQDLVSARDLLGAIGDRLDAMGGAGARLREALNLRAPLADAQAWVEEEQKFQAARDKSVAAIRAAAATQATLDRAAIAARADLTSAILASQGDLIGVEQVNFERRMATIDQELTANLASIRTTIKNAAVADAAITTAHATATAARGAAVEALNAKVKALDDARVQAATTAYATETGAIVAELEKRIKLRAAIETRGAAAAGRTPGAEAITGLGKVDELARDSADLAKRFATLADEGVPIRDLFPEIARASDALATRAGALRTEYAAHPAVLDKLDSAMRVVELGGFAASVANADAWLRVARADTFGLAEDVASLSFAVGDGLPAGVSLAEPAIDRLIGRIAALEIIVRRTRGEIQGLADDLGEDGP